MVPRSQFSCLYGLSEIIVNQADLSVTITDWWSLIFFSFITKKKISFSYPWFTWKTGMRSTQKNPIQLHRFSVSLSTYEVYSVPREWITFLLNLYSPCFYRKFILDRFYQSWNSQVVGKQVCLERVSGNLKVSLQWLNNLPHILSSEK